MDPSGEVRAAIYAAILDSGRAPTPAEVASAIGADADAVAAAFRALAAAHVIVLRPGTLEIAWAPPFSVVATPFRVTAGSSWHAPCAWDAFGIAAAVKRDAVIDARCAWSGERIDCGVRGGSAHRAGAISPLFPAAPFWGDIAHT